MASLRCKCGGYYKKKRKEWKCAKCGRFMSYNKRLQVLSEVPRKKRIKERRRKNYLKIKGEKKGYLSAKEAAEYKGQSFLWMWNNCYLFNYKTKPLRIMFDKKFISYNRGSDAS